jgi:hypothetical protein
LVTSSPVSASTRRSRAGIEKLIAAQTVTQNDQFDLGGSRVVVAVPAGRSAPDVNSIARLKPAAAICHQHACRAALPDLQWRHRQRKERTS